MAIPTDYNRIIIKRTNTPLTEPTIPAVEPENVQDIEDMNATDLIVGEMFCNIYEDRLWIRTINGIQEIDLNGKGGGGGTSGPGKEDITLASLITKMDQATLVPGTIYYLIGEKVYVTAISDTEISSQGVREQYIILPKYFSKFRENDIEYIGTYGIDFTDPIKPSDPNDVIYRAIYDDSVYQRDETGTDVDINDGWTKLLKPDAVYRIKHFSITFEIDVSASELNIITQTDNNNNTVINTTISEMNSVDLHSWGNPNITNNITKGIFNISVDTTVYGNNNEGFIYNNKADSIYYNNCVGDIFDNDIVGIIARNTLDTDITGNTGTMDVYRLPVPTGLEGPEGPQGPAGPVGPIGPKGDMGLTGMIGPVGPQGIQGPIGPKGDDGTIGPIGPQGPKGDKGDQGADSTVPGPQGPIGPKGDKGDKGDDGADSTVPGPQGPKGDKGDQGEQGPIGPEGPQGPAGVDGVDGTIVTNFYIGVNFQDLITFEYVNGDEMKINTIDNPDSISYTIKVNGVSYTLGNTINLYDTITIEPTNLGYLKLNCELV